MNVDNISKERFLKAKKAITKKYPGAHTMRDPQGKFYVATATGRDICNLSVGQAIDAYNFEGEDDLFGFNAALNKVATIPHSETITKAWQQAEIAIKSFHVVDRNNSKFSDEKIMKKTLKDE